MKGWRVMLGNQALDWASPLLVVFGCSCSIESVCARRGVTTSTGSSKLHCASQLSI